MKTFVKRLDSRTWLLVSGSVWLLFAALFFQSTLPFAVGQVEAICGLPPLDIRFTSSAAEVDQFLAACGIEGRSAYRNMQLADLLYPAVFGTFMASALAVSLGRLRPGPMATMASSLPLVGAALDYVENLLVWIALLTYPGSAATSSFLGLVSAAKTITFWMAGLLLLAALAALVGRSGLRVLSAGIRPALASGLTAGVSSGDGSGRP